jgi:Transglutaminase-like superfamily
MRRLRRFLALSTAEQWRTIEALLLPFAIGAGFRIVGVPRTQAWLRQLALTRKSRTNTADPEAGIRIACRAQGRVFRTTGVRGPCLVRSLTLWTMLARSGIEASLRVGFRKRDGKFEGHAWVEHAGIPINEDPDEASTFTAYDEPVSFDLLRKGQVPEPTAPV